jgi:hypothetical protein
MQLTTVLGLALALVAAPAAARPAANEPDPGTVTIQNVGYGGTGCPQGSVSTIFSPDLTTLTMIFDSYVASLGPGIAVTESRKNCQLNLDVRYPAGFQYSIFSADYRGYAKLDADVTGVQKSIYYFSGQSEQASYLTSISPAPSIPKCRPTPLAYPQTIAHLSLPPRFSLSQSPNRLDP